MSKRTGSTLRMQLITLYAFLARPAELCRAGAACGSMMKAVVAMKLLSCTASAHRRRWEAWWRIMAANLTEQEQA